MFHLDNFNVLFSECVYRFTSSRGQIRSKNYPRNYDNNLDCRYYITVPQNYQIQISFSTIDLESGPNCNYDFVRLYDGRDSSKRTIGKYCGIEIPPVTKSTGNELMIQFKTDDRGPRKGFLLDWRQVQKPVEPTPPKTVATTPPTQPGNYMSCDNFSICYTGF